MMYSVLSVSSSPLHSEGCWSPSLCSYVMYLGSVCGYRGAVRRKFWDRGHSTPNITCELAASGWTASVWNLVHSWNSGYFCLFGKSLVLDPLDRNVHSTFHSVPLSLLVGFPALINQWSHLFYNLTSLIEMTCLDVCCYLEISAPVLCKHALRWINC